MTPVKNIMTTDVVYVNPDTFVYEAMELLLQHHISGLPVVNADMKIVGILTEKDLLKLLMNPKVGGSAAVSAFMNSHVVCFSEEDTVIKVCEFFIKNNIRRAPIARDGKLVGIVSRRDIIRLIMELRSTISDYLPN